MKRYGEEVIIEVEDVIKPEKVEEYRKELDIVRNQLSAIANNLIVMERLTNFPYHLFVADDRSVFWVLTIKAFFDSTILALYTVLDKGSSRGHQHISLRTFRRKVCNPEEFRIDGIDKEVWDILTKRISDVKFEKSISLLEEQIRAVRNQHIAHLDRKKILVPEEIVSYRLPLSTLREALKVLNSLFQVLGLGVWHQLEFWDYGDSTRKLDIDEILELVAGSSYWFCDDPLIDVEAEYEKLSDTDRVILDAWRGKLDKL